MIQFLGFVFLLGFLIWAMRDVARSNRLSSRLAMTAAAPSALGLCVIGSALLVGLLLRLGSDSLLMLTKELVFYGAFMGLSAFAFLLASLVIARDARRCGIPRPWPLLDRVRDRLGLNKRGSKRARPAIHWAEAVPLLLGMILLSAAWLKLAVHFFDARIHPQLGELIAQSKEWSEAVNLLRFLPPLLLAPLYEELIYRAYIQDRLLLFFRKKRLPRAGSQALLATAITAGVWALQHSGMIAPDWVKFIQIFIVGLFLGLARLRLGLEACVLIHALYNAAGCMYAPPELGALILP